jgi:hypothetical protein
MSASAHCSRKDGQGTFGQEPPASPTNLEIITGVSHVLEPMLFARCGAEDELLTSVGVLHTLRSRLETEPVEATEYFCPLQVKRKATRARTRDD